MNRNKAHCASLVVVAMTCGLSAPFARASTPIIGPNVNLTKSSGNQYEPAVAINPNDARQIFIAARNEVGGLYVSRSSDGGNTWTGQLIATSTLPQAGDVPRAYGNVSVAWDAFGNLFMTYLLQATSRSAAYVALAVSTDGGATFKSPISTSSVLTLPIIYPPLSGDQPTVTVGPGSGGFAGSVWLTYFTQGGIAVSNAGVMGPGAVAAFTSQLLPAQPAGVNYGDIAVGPNGEVAVTYGPNAGATGGTVYVQVDPDGLGPAGFGMPVPVVATNVGGFTFIPAQPNWGVDPEAGLAFDRTTGPHRGRLYLLYTDATAPGGADTNIFVVSSDDRGATWSAPSRVNDDTGTNSQFLPRLALDQSTGALAATWLDARNSPANSTAQYWGAFSTDGGATFGTNFQISQGTSNQANSVAALRKADYGDYTGSAFSQGVLIPAWADNSNSTGDNPDGATGFEVYTAAIQLPVAVPPVTNLGFPAPPTSGWFTAAPVWGTASASSSGSTIARIDCTGAVVSALAGLGTASATAQLSAWALGNTTVACTSTDASGVSSPPVTTSLRIDSVLPTLAPSLLPATPMPLLYQVLTAAPNAADTLSGVASASCGAVDTSTLGAHSVICSATDNAGETASATLPYQAGAAMANLTAPPARPVRQGAAVPLMVQLLDANNVPLSDTISRSLGRCGVRVVVASAPPQCLSYRSVSHVFAGRVILPENLPAGTVSLFESAYFATSIIATATQLVRVGAH